MTEYLPRLFFAAIFKFKINGNDLLLNPILISIRYINVAVCTIWSVTNHNSRHINIENLLNRVQRIERNINLQICTKLTNCGGNCIAGNMARDWRMWGVKVQILRRFNHLTPNGHYMGRTAQLTSRYCILCIYSTNICTEYFKHAA